MVLVIPHYLVHIIVRNGLLSILPHVLPFLVLILVIDLPFSLISIFLFVYSTLMIHAIDCHVVDASLTCQSNVLSTSYHGLLLALVSWSTVKFYYVVKVINRLVLKSKTVSVSLISV